jgi:Zn-finger protein
MIDIEKHIEVTTLCPYCNDGELGLVSQIDGTLVPVCRECGYIHEPVMVEK